MELQREFSRQVYPIIFVFGLVIAVFWLLFRSFPGLFIQNPKSSFEAQSPPARPTHWSTWAMLALTVLAGGLLIAQKHSASPPDIIQFVQLLFFVASNVWIFVHLVAWGVRLAGSKDRTPPTAFQSDHVTRPQTTASSQPLSPWRFLGWVLALTLGPGIVSSLGLAVALFVSWMAMSNAPNPTLTHSGPHPAYVTIRSSLGEKITGVTVDGSPAFLTSLGEGMCQLNIEPGSRSIIVSFESPDPQNYERVYSTLVNVSKSQAVEIEAVPVNQARKATATEIEARFESALTLENDTARHNTLVRLAEDAANAGHGELVLKVIGSVKAGTARNNTCAICSEALLRQGLISAATAVAQQLDNDTSRNNMLARIANASSPPPIPQSSNMGPMGMPSASSNSPSSGTSLDRTGSSESPSIPLADAVEVLTDPATMPIYPYGIGTYGSNQLNTQVWIDEPGLIVRLKPLDFEGHENSVVELVSNPAWGVGWFTGREDSFPVMDVPPGRYRVLVQDLDYGWSLDRRGTIIIGRGKQTIHVKRSFAGQQITPTEYPVPFRWAGKSYQLTTADQVSTINQYLAKLAGESAKPIPGTDAQGAGANMSFWNHPLYQQIDTNFPQLESSLKYSRQLLKLELPDDSDQESIVFDHPQGVISWKRSVPEGFHIPSGELKYHVSYEPGFWWPGDDSQTLDIETLKDQRLVIGPQTKAMMREAMNREYDFSQIQASTLIWFREQSTTIPIAAVPAAKRLILAWLDGQPDVPESELLARYPKDTMFESLWKMGLPADQLMPAILVPGSTPGTWRMKEPPKGALIEEPSIPLKKNE